MRAIICLLGLAGAGLAFLLLPASTFNLNASQTTGLYAVWLGSLKSFAVPSALLVMSLTRGILIKVCNLIWGVWMLLLTTAVVTQASSLLPSISAEGTGLAGSVLLFSLGLSLFSLLDLYPASSKRKLVDDKPLKS